MPTYTITTKPNQFDYKQKEKIAKCVTQTHCKITGAPSYYAQVVFQDCGFDRFVGGKPSDSQVWIRADIRSGRSKETRKQLVEELVKNVAKTGNIKESNVWVYLNILEPTDMAEYGQILPEAGKENEWFNKLPEDLQKELNF